MNHILLPDSISNSGIENLHGAAAMEVLINALLKRGASKSRLRGKIFGGAQMVSGLSSIGKANGTFVRNFLRQEGIPIDAECLGGVSARRVEFSPVSGHARQKLMKAQVEEQAVVRVQINDVELF
ncbi:chemotaxis protein CheD [Halocynthiibacter sp. C4]|uniref:chemotaxis protein CheD n=1 Tax=Halocynthiibacter sp. C4 TaxID=2992758 RepID=UPI00237B8FAE|nr:chemotaxis protein CheD [Halocynthiibacter sp. C4]MDE0589476.1 chemotaxis protein CheD [Halocynthiibacter sp. C4]